MTDGLDRLPRSLRARVAAALQPGERVLWAGMPGVAAATLPTLLLFGFGIGWSSLTFTWEGIALAGLFGALKQADGSAPPLGFAAMMAVFGLPFVAVGVALLSAPFVAAFRAMLTAHVVTDSRLLTVTGAPWRRTDVRTVASITFLRRRDGRSGRGTLRLGFGTEKDSDGDTRSIEETWPGLDDVAGAEAAVRALAASAGRKV